MMKQEADLDSEKQIYLTCEKYYIFELLIFAAGMMGAYTFNLRGGVFCNAQTANVVLMALSFGKGEIATITPIGERLQDIPERLLPIPERLQ